MIDWAGGKKKFMLYEQVDKDGSLIFLQDGFKDDSLRIKKDIERSSPHCQVC